MMITGEENIKLFRLFQLKAALKLELKGMKISRGRSAYSIIKDEFNLRGNKQKVLTQFEDIINEVIGE